MSDEAFEEAVAHSMQFLNEAKGRGENAELQRQGYDDMGRSVIQRDPQALIRVANVVPEGLPPLLFGIAAEVEAGRILNVATRNWLAAYLRGEWVPPKKAGRKRRYAWDFNIWLLARVLIDVYEITPTRNDVSDVESACDVIAEAIRRMGETPTSYGGVKSVYLRINRDMRAREKLRSAKSGDALK